MTHALPSIPGHVTIHVDLISVTADGMTVRDRADGRIHAMSYDGVLIAANERGCFTLSLPPHIANTVGLSNAE